MTARSHRRTSAVFGALALVVAGVVAGMAHDLEAHGAILDHAGPRFEVAHERPIAAVHVEPSAVRHVELCAVCSLRRAAPFDASLGISASALPPTAIVEFPSREPAPANPVQTPVRGRAPPIV